MRRLWRKPPRASASTPLRHGANANATGSSKARPRPDQPRY
jgi:hypothetical protein